MRNLTDYEYISKLNLTESLASFASIFKPKLGDSIESLNIFYAINSIITPSLPMKANVDYLNYLFETDQHPSVVMIKNFSLILNFPDDINMLQLLQKLHNHSFCIKDNYLRVHYIFNFILLVGQKNYFNFLLPSYLITDKNVNWDDN